MWETCRDEAGNGVRQPTEGANLADDSAVENQLQTRVVCHMYVFPGQLMSTPNGLFVQIVNFTGNHCNCLSNVGRTYIIGISPQGSVTFIPAGWGGGGRVSDKHIVQKSGILANLFPGDIVMADRGFKIDEDVAFYQAKLVIHPHEVEKTRKIANVHIHVERVIGLVIRKF